MYTMTIDKRPLYDPTRTGYALEIPAGTFEANKIGTFTFTIYPDNPEYYSITPRVSVIRVYRDGEIYSVYRPVRARRMFQGGVEYTCEEMTALLNDFMHRPAAFPVNPEANTARDLMELCVSEFNQRSTDARIVPPRDYIESLWPFTFLGTSDSYRFSAGTLVGSPAPWVSLEDIVESYSWPPMAFKQEMANVLAVLGYFGNIYIPPSYDWPQVYAAMKKFADAYGIKCGHRRIYDGGDYIDWESDDGWDDRVVEERLLIGTLSNVYYEYIQNLPDENDPDESENDEQSFVFSVGDTPAAYESEPDPGTGNPIPIPLTVEENGYSGYWDYMQSSIVEQLGGYIIPEWGENSCTLHYKRDEHLPTCNQEIRFGENMVDLLVETDAEKVYSIVIPLGKDGLTINTDPDEPDYIADADAVNMYGKREMTKDWEDITDPQQLKHTATQWLLENAIRLKDEFEVNALDLRYAGVNVEHLEFMHRVNVQMDRYRINQLCTMTGAEIGYDTPVNDTYHFNGERDSLVDKVRK